MAHQTFLSEPMPSPDLSIPSSPSTVDVRIIDTTTYGQASTSMMFTPVLHGHDTFTFPSFAFLISNTSQDKHILFDMGMNRSWETAHPPQVVGFFKEHMPMNIERNIDEILDDDPGRLGIRAENVSSAIWSHHHSDHRGDLAAFPSSTEIIVGPGFTKAYLPPYPTNAASSIAESELKGRHLRELDLTSFTLKVRNFPAHDFFGDGSFYLLSAPGHTVSHLCGLARVSTTPSPSFVFMGGDCAHYAAIFRPTEYVPLPKELPTIPGSRFGVAPCPGAWLEECIHPKKSATEPFISANPSVNEDPQEAKRSVSAMQEFDASPDVLVCISHDAGLLGHLDFYPKTLNDWKAKGMKQAVHWNFCGDFDVEGAKTLAESVNEGSTMNELAT